MRKLNMIFAALWLMITSANAAMPDDGKEAVLPVQEKVYLHFDNNCYFLGDTIWYKAYIVLADDNTPQPLSRILYVELLNEQGYIMERQQLSVSEQGQANGQFALLDTIFPGYYEIRAYTKYMLNFGYERVPSWFTRTWLGYGDDKGTIPYDMSKGKPEEDPERIYNGGYDILMDEEKRIESGKFSADMKKVNVKHIDSEYESGFSIDPRGMDKNYRSYNNLFSRVIPVYNRPDSAQNYMRKIMPTKITMGDYEVRWKTDEFDVKFYPEGGTLLENTECRVAWEAMNQELERLNVVGALLEDGEVIDSLHPYHAGRGFFTFVPQHGKSYKARFIFGEHKFDIKLPKAEKTGARLMLDIDEEAVYFNVAKKFESNQELLLNIFCRGKKVKTFKVTSPDKWEDAMYLDDLPEGVNQAVLVGGQGEVYADRLFFVNRVSEAKGRILVAGVQNRAYKPLEHVRLNLLATDAKGRALKDQTFSVAVRDANQLDPTFSTGNMLTNLLLESEIKGFVENPDYYFEANDEKHRTALDLLLMVQGWRRYDWQYVEWPHRFQLDYLPEQKMVIYGNAMALRKKLFVKDLGKLQISCSIMNLNDNLKEGDYFRFTGVTEADSAGNFQMVYEPFYGNVRLTLRAKFVRKLEKKNYDLVSHDKEIFIRKQYFYPDALKQLSWYETHSPEYMKDKKLTWEEFQDDIYASEWIPQVNIKTRKRAHSKRQKDKPVFRVDMLDFVNDKWDQGYYDPFYKMDGKEFSIPDNMTLFDSYVRMQYVTSPKNYEGHMPSFGWLSGIFSSQIDLKGFLPGLKEMIIVSDAPRRPTPYEHYHLDRTEAGIMTMGIDSYINFIEFPEGQTRVTSGREYNLQGFTRPVEFYSPDYSKAKLPEVKDYRRTLYWNPNVTTNNMGQATIDFYNSSVCEMLDISAEGISRYGEFLIADE